MIVVVVGVRLVGFVGFEAPVTVIVVIVVIGIGIGIVGNVGID